jgi:hypothetical protein
MAQEGSDRRAAPSRVESAFHFARHTMPPGAAIAAYAGAALSGRSCRPAKDSVLALYDLMIHQKRSEEATAKLVAPDYIQHNPLIADGSFAEHGVRLRRRRQLIRRGERE